MNRTVMVTGANRGLGLAMAEAFIQAGDWLIFHSRRTPNELPEIFSYSNCSMVTGDLCELATLERLAKAGSSGVDILINNAGMYLGGTFGEMRLSDIRSTICLNLVAPMLLTRLLWSTLIERSGMVVNIGSLAGTAPGPGETAYAAAKAGLGAFSEALQYDATESGVRVIHVNLGAMNTGMTIGRKCRDKFIDPVEVAGAIISICNQHRTMRSTSITLKRRIY